MARVISVNVGTPRTVEHKGELVTSAIWKHPIAGRVAVGGVNLAGDRQADRSAHGGVDKAVYAYAREDYEWWGTELGTDALGAAMFGENLTVAELPLNACELGERWRVGSALLEVSEPRFPCRKLAIRMDDPRFVKRFAVARRPGAYLRIVGEGELGAGDEIKIVRRPGHGVTIGRFAEAYLGDRRRLIDLLAADALSDKWREWIERTAQRSGA